MKTTLTSLSAKIIAAASLAFCSVVAQAKPLSQEKVRSTSNEIDQFVATYLQKKKTQANPIIDDSIFLRRAYISISGRIPTSQEAEKFLLAPDKDKRSALVDTLIQSNGYKSRMFNFWADLLRLQTNQERFGLGWHSWIRDAVDSNMPYDEFVNAMLSAEGTATENPAVGYYLRDSNMLLDNVSNSAQIFLGTQIGCAQCHDHPFDDLTQKQYYEFAAFIGGTNYRHDAARHLIGRMAAHTMKEKGITPPDPQSPKNRKKLQAIKKYNSEKKKLTRNYSTIFREFRRNATSIDPRKSLRLPHDYQYNDGKPGEVVSPQTIFGDPIPSVSGEKRQQAFANWITSTKNPRFTKVIVNRLWAEVFGRGIVASLDDWSETTRISHPELLDYLCEIMKATDYDVKQFMRILYHTRLFESVAASQEAARGGSYDFHGPVLRRMSAEELHDSLQVIKAGNRDDVVNDTIKKKWEAHVNGIEKLFAMPVPQVIAMDQLADKRETEIYALRAEARKLKLAVSKAQGEGDIKKAQQLKIKLNKTYAATKKKTNESKDKILNMLVARNLRANSRTPMLRASEKPAPAKPGSFMRQFGGSDRQITNASHTQASIPQALSLLNGKEIASMVEKKGLLAKNLKRASSSSERLEELFLSIYGQMPSESERERYEPLMQSPKDITPLVKAMLNSKRFLFVQ